MAAGTAGASGRAGVRARVRAELSAEITAIARRQLAEEGANAINLRAIAREMGMASSAVYRYFASRDELLTALIVDAYNELGRVAEEADVTDGDPVDRFVAVADAAYRWAMAEPNQYLLLFGTPVPGYAAPSDTIAPATRFSTVLLRILDAGHRRGDRPQPEPDVAPSLRADLERIRALNAITVPDEHLVAGLQAWTGLFGVISFVLNGQFHHVVDDVDALVSTITRHLAQQVFGGGNPPDVASVPSS